MFSSAEQCLLFVNLGKLEKGIGICILFYILFASFHWTCDATWCEKGGILCEIEERGIPMKG